MCSARSPQTAEQYAYAAERFLLWLEGENVADVPSAPKGALARYCEELTKRGFLPATIKVQVAAVRRYCDWLKRQGHEVPEFDAPEPLRAIPRRVRDALSPKQLGQYMSSAAAIPREPVRTACILLASTGLRSGEVVVLDLRCARTTVLELNDGSTKNVQSLVVRGKGGHERIVPLLEEGVQVLHDYLSGWRRQRRSRWLFPGNQDGHLAAHTLRRAVAEIRPDGVVWTPHTLRRTYLTSLYRDGVDPVVLAKIAGHSDVRTLIQHYLSLDEQDVLKAVHKQVS